VKTHLKILITAGPTIEFIDPVRFISNLSTGKMGYEIAKLAKQRKSDVLLISGPSTLTPPKGVKVINIQTALEMQRTVKKELKSRDVLIMASAVCDFKVSAFSTKKIKSNKAKTLKLIKNPDILKSLSKKERKNKVIVGFALETENLIPNARKKMTQKEMDIIVANKISKKTSPFGEGEKHIVIIDRYGHIKKLYKKTKDSIARTILDTIYELCYTSR